jgi:hypothetical protein
VWRYGRKERESDVVQMVLNGDRDAVFVTKCITIGTEHLRRNGMRGTVAR